MDRLRKIYESLEDAQSQYIFSQRLMYSISGDKHYVREMVDHEIEFYKDADVMYSLLSWIKPRIGTIVLFGGGFAGQQIVECLFDYGIVVDYIADNNAEIQGKSRYGILVISPEKLRDIKQLSVIIGVNRGKENVYSQLSLLNVPDEDIFIPQKDWWIGKYDQYFDEDILKPSKKECFVDGGALDGNDSIRFIRWSNETYNKVIALEPDKKNCDETRRALAIFPNAQVYEKGLWKENTMLRFNSGAQENSAISDTGEMQIETVAIDELEQSNEVSFIKMDIEGSEAMALEGARNTIIKNRPKLAICVYHKPEDIISLPAMILDMIPDYKLYLRHYSYTDTETVLYAV